MAAEEDLSRRHLLIPLDVTPGSLRIATPLPRVRAAGGPDGPCNSDNTPAAFGREPIKQWGEELRLRRGQHE